MGGEADGRVTTSKKDEISIKKEVAEFTACPSLSW